MGAGPPAALPALTADLLLVHAPAVFEFRDRRDIYFPFLGTSGDVPITPLYEYFPVGFKTLQRYLGDRGHDVALLNLSTLLLRYRHLAIEDVFAALDAPLVGIDLHWMIHAQGSLELAAQLKRARPDVQIVLGGISATYFADELIRRPEVDFVMKGYDTHGPVDALLRALRGDGSLHAVPNLVWKQDGRVRDNAIVHMPDTYGCGIDWSAQPPAPKTKGLPILELMSTQNAGCAYNCPWCGGSRDAFRRIFQRKRAMARKPAPELALEFDTMTRLERVSDYHFYSVGSYNESPASMRAFVDLVGNTPLRSVSYEQFHLTPDDVLQRMAAANPRTSITLSPESHDPRIARLCGRGVFTNEQMEAWIGRALDYGIHAIDVWYFIGMPEQTEQSAMETVEYCERLLQKFKGANVNPMVCPMIPLLDPASNIFERPDDFGYRIFFRTAEDHRRGLSHASLINRLNYETKWLSRTDLVRVGFQAIKALMSAKAAHGILPGSMVRRYNAKVDDAWEFLQAVHAAEEHPDPAALAELGDDIARRNDAILFHGVANQAFPINRQVGGRWFDELGWDPEVLDAYTAGDE